MKRRDLIINTSKVLSAAALGSVAPLSLAASNPVKTLNIKNIHTGEQLNTVYWSQGGFDEISLLEIDNVLRDHRRNESTAMDHNIINLLNQIQSEANLIKPQFSKEPIQIISGFRSEKTNQILRQTTKGVAKKSFHMQGRAVDIRIEGWRTEDLYSLCKSMQCGGVGLYEKSGFIHLDTGWVRSWKGA